MLDHFFSHRSWPAWRGSERVARVTLLMALAASAALAFIAWSNLRAASDLDTAADSIETRTRAALQVQPGASVPDLQSVPAALLGPHIDTAEVLARLQSSALRTGVAFEHMDASPPLVDATGWERLVLQVSASGEYPAVKAWLAELHGRLPSLTVSQLRLARDNGAVAGGEARSIKVTATLTLWSPPVAQPSRPRS